MSNKAFVKSCSLENITSSFRRTGIFPFNLEIFTEDEFLPSTVTDQVQNVYSGESNIDSSVLNTTEASVQSTSTPASSTPGLEAAPKTSLIESITPLPKARPQKIWRRKRVSSAIFTRTPVKKRPLPQQSGDSSTDEEKAFADSESNASLSDGDASLAP